MDGVLKTDSGVFIRHSYWSNENMKKTFNQCLYAITGNEFNPKDWTNGMSCHEDDDDNYCICGHRIKNLYYIKYIPTGIQVQVGDTCVKKIDEKLHKRITSDNFCILCDEPIGKKLKVHKQGFCTDTCKRYNNIGKWNVLFGKYKGLTFNEVFEKDKKYLEEYVYSNTTNRDIQRWIEIKFDL